MTGQRWSARLLVVGVALALFVLVIQPIVGIVTRVAFDSEGEPTLAHLARARELAAPLATTLAVVAASVVGALAVGVPLALVCGLVAVPGRRLFTALFFLPVTLPPLVGALAVRALVGERGMIARAALELGFASPPHLGGWAAVLFVHTLTLYPIVFGFVLAALAGMDRRELEAARVLGAGRLARGWHVLRPALAPALVAACTLVAMSALASFTAPYYFCPESDYLTLLAYKTRGNDPVRSALATLALALAALAIVTLLVARERAMPTRAAATGVAPGAARRVHGLRGVLLGVALGLIAALLLVPHVVVLWLGLAGAWRPDAIVPGELSLAHHASLWSEPEGLRPLVTSGWMALAGVLGATVLGVAAAWCRRRLVAAGGSVIEVVATLPFALPGTALGLALVTLWSSRWGIGLLPPLAGTIVALPLAYAIRELPLVFRGASAALAAAPRDVEEAARTLGASGAAVFRRVLAPRIAPAVTAAALLAFLAAFGEFPASILLYTPDNVPVAVHIDRLFRDTPFGRPFAYASWLILVELAIVVTVAGIGGGRAARRETRARLASALPGQ